MENLYLNYSELAFIMKIKPAESKFLFEQILQKDKAVLKDTVIATEFIGRFEKVTSCDLRYDGLDKFEFYLDQCKKSFKGFINEKTVVKKKKFNGGKTVFYKILTPEQFEAEAKKVFQKWIRMRDKDEPCISCGSVTAKEWHGSHFFSANLYSGLIFDERNVHKACDYCNVFLHGNLLEYRKGLIKRYGFDYVAKLEADSDLLRNYKYTKNELIAKKLQYEIKIKELI